MDSKPCNLNSLKSWAVVVAQLGEQSFPTPEVRGSNPIIDIKDRYSTNYNLDKSKIKENGGREWSSLKNRPNSLNIDEP